MKRYFMCVLALLCCAAAFAGLTSQIRVETYSLQTGTTIGDNVPEDRYLYTVTTAFTDGTGDDQADTVYRASRELGAGASETLNLYSGLTDAFGASVSFATLKAVSIYNTSASQTLTIGSGSLPLLPWSDISTATTTIAPNGVFVWCRPNTGATVASSSACCLHIENNAGASCTYRIFLLGVGN